MTRLATLLIAAVLAVGLRQRATCPIADRAAPPAAQTAPAAKGKKGLTAEEKAQLKEERAAKRKAMTPEEKAKLKEERAAKKAGEGGQEGEAPGMPRARASRTISRARSCASSCRPARERKLHTARHSGASASPGMTERATRPGPQPPPIACWSRPGAGRNPCGCTRRSSWLRPRPGTAPRPRRRTARCRA